jgi:4-amino-4-deoxy-L-arabinose transferase-like glycosyltransferase
MPAPEMSCRNQKSYWILVGVITLLAAALEFYAQTDAFAWDEGFHLLTAELITRGKRPYLDFNFSQTPLNAYWNAFWMMAFEQSWRVAHAVAALMTSGAILMTADYLFVRFPVAPWRLAAALMASFLLFLNVLIVQYGPIGQAYGLCLFLLVAAFRLTVVSVDRQGLLFPALAGFLASAGAAATLLGAPACPVLAVWMAVQNRMGNRWAKLIAFVSAAAIPFLPVLYLFLKGPRQTLFNIIQYNLIFRQVEWPGAIPHDIGVIMSWLNSAQALLVGLLALAGLLFIRFRSDWGDQNRPDQKWTREQRAEFYLCGWLALALGAYISSAHPTFQRYYLFTLPFLSILAAAGLYSLSTRLYAANRPFWPIFALTAVFSLELAKALHDKHDNINWLDLEKVAAKVDEVTPPDGLVLSDEPIYFLTRRPPPSGMELADSHKLDFPPERAVPLHLVSESEEIRQLNEGRFATGVDCDKGHKLGEEDFKRVYRQKFEFDTCTVYWDWGAR